MTRIKVWSKPEDFRIELLETEGRYFIAIEHYSGNDEKVIVPSSFASIPVTAIGSFAFIKNENLKNIVLPDSLTSIESDAFTGCLNLEEVNLPQSLASIDYRAFENCRKLSTISLPKELTEIEGDAFSGCVNLFEIIVDKDNPVYASGNGVLFDKNMTTLIFYPEGKIGEYTVPESVITIEEHAFSNCKKLLQITLPKNLMAMNSNFYGCEHLGNIEVCKDNAYFSDIEGVLFNKEETILLEYPPGRKNKKYIIPDKVTHISANAFNECKWLEHIYIPESIKFIGDRAFSKCERLSEITLLANLYIGNEVFKDCPMLKNINLSEKTKMGYRALKGFSGEINYRTYP